jgi:cytochrome oxidase Cu insertion factor (SCO1/SenC/PrrC family)
MLSQRTKVHAGLISAVVVLLICMSVIIGGAVRKGDLHAGLPGSIAPDFFLHDADNHPVELSDFRGNVVIVYYAGRASGATTLPAGAALPSRGPQPIESHAADPQSPQATALAPTARDKSVADLAQLSLVCRDIQSSRVKLISLQSLPDGDRPLPLDAPLKSGGDAGGDAAGSPEKVQTLFDSNGEATRRLKIDVADAKPTFFVIDPTGVIRYRGNTLPVGEAASAKALLQTPATVPSSDQEVPQTLLTSEAATIATPGHF